MTLDLVDRIAAAVLYEGYLLYPYRASAMKNRQRFNFGAVMPRDYSAAQSDTEAWTMRSECLIQGQSTSIRIRTRFLHLMNRQVARFQKHDSKETSSIPQSVDFLETNGRRYQSWQEAIEREVDSFPLSVPQLIESPQQIPFCFGPDEVTEFIRDGNDDLVGQIVRTQHQVHGALSLEATRLADELCRLRVTICNETPLPNAETLVREQALLYALASTHTVMTVDAGTFVSLLDPPLELVDAAASCQQVGCWPVLVGEMGDRRTMLASPIILYDYPQIAEESPGDFFDGTEIDEMLMLRVMTMTPEEQWEMRHVDDQARRLLERTQALPQDDLLKLHGTIRGFQTIDRSQKT